MLASVVLTVVTACSGGSDTVDGKDVEKSIVKQLHRDFAGASVGATKCPKDVKKKSGKEFACIATVGSEPVPIKVTQTDKDPGYRATREVAVLDVAKVQSFVTTQYDQAVGVAVTAACAPGKSVVVAKPQTTISCSVTDAVGATDTVQVIVNDTNGNISISTI